MKRKALASLLVTQAGCLQSAPVGLPSLLLSQTVSNLRRDVVRSLTCSWLDFEPRQARTVTRVSCSVKSPYSHETRTLHVTSQLA